MTKPNVGIIIFVSVTSGTMQWVGVGMAIDKELFLSPLYDEGTDVIGNYLGLVHGLALIAKNVGYVGNVYCECQTAIEYVTKGYCLPTLAPSERIKALLIRANTFLKENPHLISRVELWKPEWGQNPAHLNF